MEIKITAVSTQEVGKLIDAIITALNSHSESYTIESTIQLEKK